MNAEEQKVLVWRNGLTWMGGWPEDVREMLEKKLATRIDMEGITWQESLDEDGYQIYLHTDTYEELEEEELVRLSNLEISDDPTRTTKVVCELLNITQIDILEARP